MGNHMLLRCWVVALLMLPGVSAVAQDGDGPDADPAVDGEVNAELRVDATDRLIAHINEDDNAITINRGERYVDLEARICLREAEFLEMFVCSPDTREHESILVSEATPSVIHTSLLLIGLEPGTPLSYDRNFDPPRLVPATGPKVRVFVVIEVDGGAELEVPANRWVKDNQTGRAMPDNAWVFAGSQIAQVQDERVYYADVNGSVISLVNFGDDLLTLDNEMTQDNDSHDQVWAPLTEAIPEVGTTVTIRLRPEPTDPEDEQAG